MVAMIYRCCRCLNIRLRHAHHLIEAFKSTLEEAKYAANNQLGPYYEYSVARNMLETLAKQK